MKKKLLSKVRQREQINKAKYIYGLSAAANGSPMTWDDLDEATRIHWVIFSKGYIEPETKKQIRI